MEVYILEALMAIEKRVSLTTKTQHKYNTRKIRRECGCIVYIVSVYTYINIVSVRNSLLTFSGTVDRYAHDRRRYNGKKEKKKKKRWVNVALARCNHYTRGRRPPTCFRPHERERERRILFVHLSFLSTLSISLCRFSLTLRQLNFTSLGDSPIDSLYSFDLLSFLWSNRQ